MKAPTNQQPDALDVLLGKSDAPSTPAPRRASAAASPPAAAAQGKESYKPWSSQISAANARRFKQYQHHAPGVNKSQDVFNKALRLLFDTYPQYADKEIPQDE